MAEQAHKNYSDYLSAYINKESKGIDSMKRISGVVKEVYKDQYETVVKAKVQILQKNVTLLNKTGETLAVGDNVWVHYWNDITSGYIAIRNGEPNVSGGFKIDKAVAMTPNQANIYTVSTEVINVDVANQITVKYGDPKNVFFANGQPVVVNPGGTTSERAAYYSGLSLNLYSQEVGYTTYGGDDISLSLQMTNAVYSVDYTVWGMTYGLLQVENGTDYERINTTTLQTGDVFARSLDGGGILLTSSRINGSGSATPYGSVTCTVILLYNITSLDGTNYTIIKESNTQYTVPFASEAEYNYAVTTLTKSSLIRG